MRHGAPLENLANSDNGRHLGTVVVLNTCQDITLYSDSESLAVDEARQRLETRLIVRSSPSLIYERLYLMLRKMTFSIQDQDSTEIK